MYGKIKNCHTMMTFSRKKKKKKELVIFSKSQKKKVEDLNRT